MLGDFDLDQLSPFFISHDIQRKKDNMSQWLICLLEMCNIVIRVSLSKDNSLKGDL